mgnify:CR=1 FL=1
MVQMQMGKALTRTEIETLVSFYTYAGLPPEYILLAVSFCCAKICRICVRCPVC